MGSKRIVSSLLLCVLTSSLGAEVLVSENFDYEPGPLADRDGGEGFAGPWSVESAFTFDVVEPEFPLVYAMPGGGIINGGDRALRFSNDTSDVLDNETTALGRELGQAIVEDEVFFSFLYRYDGTEINDNDFVVWWFNEPGGPQLGLKGNFGDGSSVEDFVGRVSGAFAAPQQVYSPGIDISEEAGTLNSDWFVVGRMSKQDHSETEGDYDEFDLWVNPEFADAGNPDATGMAVASDSLATQLTSLGLRAFSQEPGDAMIWDELRIGQTWVDVVPQGGFLLGDFNEDETIDLADFNIMVGNFNTGGRMFSDGDMDFNRRVDLADFLAFRTVFAEANPAQVAVPEPSAWGALLVGASYVALRRRRFRV